MTDKAYTISDIAKAWKVDRQLVFYYVNEKRLKADIEAGNRKLWYKIPTKPAELKRGPKKKEK